MFFVYKGLKAKRLQTFNKDLSSICMPCDSRLQSLFLDLPEALIKAVNRGNWSRVVVDTLPTTVVTG